MLFPAIILAFLGWSFLNAVSAAEEVSGFIDMTGSRPGTEGSQLFFWFTPAQHQPQLKGDQEAAPFLIWLQGGPGSEGEIGLFFEIGPYTLDENINLQNRTVGNWNKEFNVLFLDQPIGTGYSTAGSEAAYATSEEEVAADLYFFFQRWLDQYGNQPGQQLNYADAPLFLTGESYAGHYIPAFAYKIMQENALIDAAAGSMNRRLNLQGVAIGDGLTEPCSQVGAGPQAAFDFGLVSPKVLAQAKEAALLAKEACAREDWAAAHDYREEMENIVLQASGINKYDVRTFESYDALFSRMDVYMEQPQTKRMLHVPQDVPFKTDEQVQQRLYEDVMQSQAWKIPHLLDGGIRVLLYQGQFDWKDGPFSNEQWIEHMEWEGRTAYLAAERRQWLVYDDDDNADDGGVTNYTTSTSSSSTSSTSSFLSSTPTSTRGAAGVPGGWVQTCAVGQRCGLTELVINAAGHLAPMNQPTRLLQMITTFVRDRPFPTPDADIDIDFNTPSS